MKGFVETFLACLLFIMVFGCFILPVLMGSFWLLLLFGSAVLALLVSALMHLLTSIYSLENSSNPIENLRIRACRQNSQEGQLSFKEYSPKPVVLLYNCGITAAKQATIPYRFARVVSYTQGLDLACIPVPDPILKREEQHHVNRKNPDL